MKASKKVLWLYLARCVIIFVLLLSAAGFASAFLPFSFLFVLFGVFAAFFVSVLYLFWRFKSFGICFDKESVAFTRGVFFRKQTRVKYRNISSLVTLKTPIMILLNLCSVSIRTQGGKFLIFPLDTRTLEAFLSEVNNFREGKM